MKKKLLICAYSLGLGGIETALISLIKNLNKDYDITLALEKKEGEFLLDLPKDIKIIQYSPANDGFILFRKIKNFIKRIRFLIKYNRAFDISISFATYSKACSFLARHASSNNILWVHNDYTKLYNKEELKKFFNSIKAFDFKKRVFVSKNAKDNFEKEFKEEFKEGNNYYINNYVDKSRFNLELDSKDEDLKKLLEDKKYKFLNIGRHDQKQKDLKFLINVVENISKKRQDFEVVFLGNGPDTNEYKEIVKKKKLGNFIKFLGLKKNISSYYKTCDSVVLSSNYEGYPVVFVEAMIFDKPIITTDVSDALIDIDKKFGDVVKKDVNEFSKIMEDYIDKKRSSNLIKFDMDEFNKSIKDKLEKILNI